MTPAGKEHMCIQRLPQKGLRDPKQLAAECKLRCWRGESVHTLRGSLLEEVWKLEGVMGCTFRKAPMAPRNPS